MIPDDQIKEMYCYDLNAFSKINILDPQSLTQSLWGVNLHRKRRFLCMWVHYCCSEKVVQKLVHSGGPFPFWGLITQGTILDGSRNLINHREFWCLDLTIFPNAHNEKWIFKMTYCSILLQNHKLVNRRLIFKVMK